MTNRSNKLCGMIMLCAISCILIVSCKKDFAYKNEEPVIVEQDDALANDSTALRLTSTYARKNLLFDYNTEATNALVYYLSPITTWHSSSAYSSRSITRTTVQARSGQYAMRFELNKSDGMVASGKRAETYRNPRGETVAKVERWYGASYFLPSDYVNDAAPESVTQWPAVEFTTGGPMLSLWTVSGEWRIVQMGKRSTAIGNYERNKWTDFVFHIKWSAGSDGLLEVWKNGVKVISKTGATMRSGVTKAPYMRTGIYKWPWNTGSKAYSATTKRVMYADEIRIGNNYATYNDVKPGS